MATQKEDKIVRGGDLATVGAQIKAKLTEKQDILVSGTNIKTVNNTSLLGNGNITISDGQDGASAYEIWLAAGNTGTEADFLASLKGDTGVSADYPIEIYNGLDSTATGSALDAVQGKILKQSIDEIDGVINGQTETVEVATAQSLTANKYYNVSSSLPNSAGALSGCYCAKISVEEGEVYRLSGYKNDNTASRLYATFSSDGTRLRYAASSSEGVRQSVELTMEEGEAYLIVNLKDYNALLGDGFWKITTTTVQTTGLIDRIDELEQNMPSVIDSLESTSEADALSANQGRVLDEDINGVTTETTAAQDLIANVYFNTNNSRVPSKSNLSTASGTYVCYLNVSPGEQYRIYGKGTSSSSVYQLYAMADSDRYVVENGTPGVAIDARENGYDLTIPNGVSILVVNLYQYSATTDKVLKIGYVTSECVKTRLSALEQADIDLASLALPLKGKKVMFFGDSITDYTYNQKGLVNYFAEASGATCYKAAVGGTRFVQRATPVDTPTSSTEAYAALDICNMVKAWCEADYTKQDAATTYLSDHTARVNALKNNPIGGVDIVCIGGGTNDMTASSSIGNDSDSGFTTIKGAINKMVELLLTANPKLKIYFYSPVVGYHGSGGRTDANWDDNHQFNSGLTKPGYIDIFEARAKANHVPYINLYWTLGWNQINFSQYFIDTDDHHPYKGFHIIGKRLYQQVINNI